MMSENQLRIGIAGGGALTRVFYLPVLKKLGLSVECLLDPYIKDFDSLSKDFEIKSTSRDPEEFGDKIDAVIIASPNFLHVQQAKYFLEKSKHVLLEKPMATTEKEALDLIDASQGSGSVLQIGMMRRFWKINKAVKEIVEANVLGELKSVSMQEGGVLNWPVQSAAIFSPQQSLGGVYMDTGSHTLDLLNWWIQDHDFDLEYRDDNHGGVEADCELLVYFKNRRIKAEIKLSRIRNMPNEFLLSGTKGWIKIKPWQNVFEASDKRIEQYIYGRYPSSILSEQKFDDLFAEQVSTWLDAIKKSTKTVVDAGSVLPSIIMLEWGYKNRGQIQYAWN